jgi:hypothetical protein
MIFELWNYNKMIMMMAPGKLCKESMKPHISEINERWEESVHKETQEVSEFTFSTPRKLGKIHDEISRAKRKSNYYAKLPLMNFEVLGYFPSPAKHPLIFETTQTKTSVAHGRPPLESKRVGGHLFVLCHGFQGNSMDMRMIRNFLILAHPESTVLCSVYNEEMTEGDIEHLGIRLSNEVTAFLGESCPGDTIGKISFIGHSLGGLIIRTALTYLSDYSHMFEQYMTLSSPHIGYMQNSSKLVSAGLWVLKKWRKAKSLQQLTMTDSKNSRETFIYKLSEREGLNWFKSVVLVSSYQDSYAPYDSARIEIQGKIKGDIYSTMARNLIEKLKVNRLVRVDVNFKIPKKNLDSFIGRAAHIEFIENALVIKMLMQRYIYI